MWGVCRGGGVGIHNRGASQWQSKRRKPSLGPVRRAHPASGCTWNVQVVRGKMSSRCLWHACRALVLGMFLMLLGAGMATIGYYANHLSIGQEVRGNATVRVKNESRGFHLNNLSYVGPIVMGFGGFIVVASCVMTFEARDSAAKVVPARFKLSTSNNRNNSATRRPPEIAALPSSVASQTNARWEQHLGLFRVSPSADGTTTDRKALTAALIHFSKGLGANRRSSSFSRVSRSGSVPNLASSLHQSTASGSPNVRPTIHSAHRRARNSSMCHRATRDSALIGNGLLHPAMLKTHRYASSFDNPSQHVAQLMHDTVTGDGVVGVARRERPKRSDTARRHVLARQKPIEKEELHSPRYGSGPGRRSYSTASDLSACAHRARQFTLPTSRTPSNDSRFPYEHHTTHSFDKESATSPRSLRRPHVAAQLSTSSVDRDLKSQLSVCSEPPSMLHPLSCQSSIEPCVPEESPDQEDNMLDLEPSVPATDIATVHPTRPDTLRINCSLNQDRVTMRTAKKAKTLTTSQNHQQQTNQQAHRHRANDFHQIYFISTPNDMPHDDTMIKVINERRSSPHPERPDSLTHESTIVANTCAALKASAITEDGAAPPCTINYQTFRAKNDRNKS